MSISSYMPAETERALESQRRYNRKMTTAISHAFERAASKERGIARAAVTGGTFEVDLDGRRPVSGLTDLLGVLYDIYLFLPPQKITVEDVRENAGFRAFCAKLESEGYLVSNLTTEVVRYNIKGHTPVARMNIAKSAAQKCAP
jgi:hypothetical protein